MDVYTNLYFYKSNWKEMEFMQMEFILPCRYYKKYYNLDILYIFYILRGFCVFLRLFYFFLEMHKYPRFNCCIILLLIVSIRVNTQCC